MWWLAQGGPQLDGLLQQNPRLSPGCRDVGHGHGCNRPSLPSQGPDPPGTVRGAAGGSGQTAGLAPRGLGSSRAHASFQARVGHWDSSSGCSVTDRPCFPGGARGMSGRRRGSCDSRDTRAPAVRIKASAAPSVFLE